MSYQPPYGAPPAGGYYPQQGGGYGQPQYPQPGHGAPPAPYGQAPSYGQAPPAGYGGAPPAPYGHQAPSAPYGGYAPPAHGQHQHQHHHHSHSQPQAYAPQQPMGGAGGTYYLGVPVPPPPGSQPLPPPPGYNVHGDVEAIRKATKGFGTDEALLIRTLAPLDAFQVDALSNQFKASTGKDLLKVLEKETSGWFEGALRAKVLGPVGYDVWLIHRACDGAGTHEDLLNEVLLCRTNADMWTLKNAYRAVYGKAMEKVVEDELSMKTKRLFVMALQGTRQEDNAPVDHRLVEEDCRKLKAAARGAGTDEITICGILVSRSTPHLQAIWQTYQSMHKQTLVAMIKSEFSGHMENALLHIAKTAQPGPPGVVRDAGLLEESMAGMGTKDERLIYRLFRAHWDRMRFEEVKRCYQGTQSKKGLRARVSGETSGDYKKMLETVIGS